MKHRSVGFGILETLLFLVIAGLVGFIGWYVYDANKKASGTLDKLPDAVGSTEFLPHKKIVAVGDIACDPSDNNFSGDNQLFCQSKKTYELLETIKPDAVLILGDIQYEDGALEKFNKSYDKDWGKAKNITYPVPGNHEYGVDEAKDYFSYFGSRAGEPGKGYYGLDLGSWHIIALNSNCEHISGCGRNSEQAVWLEQELAKSQPYCSLAFWHHPRFTSGKYTADGDAAGRTEAFWNILFEHKAELVLNGHDHIYERFAPQSPAGKPNEIGLRQFTVGTGGKNLYQQQSQKPNSEKVIDNNFGVLALELYEKSYKWQFVSTQNKVLDSGSGNCH